MNSNPAFFGLTVERDGRAPGCVILPLAGISVVCFALGCLVLFQTSRPYLSFAETDCTILEKALGGDPGGNAKARSATRLSPQLTFSYEVDGASYTATGYTLAEMTRSDRKAEQSILDGFEIGGSYRCWYDPARPSTAVLARSRPMAWFFSILPFAIAAVCALVASRLRSGRRRGPDAAS